jgi:hypothetical protein
MTAFFDADGAHLNVSARNFGIRKHPVQRTLAPDGSVSSISLGEPETIGRATDSTLQEIAANGRDWLVALDRNPLYVSRVESWPGADPARARVVAAGESMTWMTLSDDGRWLVSVMFPAAEVRIWDTATAKSTVLPGIREGVGAAFFPGGRRMVTRTPREYAIWEAGTWRKLAAWPARNLGVANRLRFAKGGEWLAVQQGRDRVQVVRTSDAVELFTLTTPKPTELLDFVWSPGADRLWTMNGHARIQEWNLTRLAEELRELGLGWEGVSSFQFQEGVTK